MTIRLKVAIFFLGDDSIWKQWSHHFHGQFWTLDLTIAVTDDQIYIINLIFDDSFKLNDIMWLLMPYVPSGMKRINK